MEISTDTTTVTVKVTTYRSETGVIGTVYEVPTGAGTLFLTQAHDWWGGNSSHPHYDPITIGEYKDPAEAADEIEKRAREAQAPDTVPGPTLNLLREV